MTIAYKGPLPSFLLLSHSPRHFCSFLEFCICIITGIFVFCTYPLPHSSPYLHTFSTNNHATSSCRYCHSPCPKQCRLDQQPFRFLTQRQTCKMEDQTRCPHRDPPPHGLPKTYPPSDRRGRTLGSTHRTNLAGSLASQHGHQCSHFRIITIIGNQYTHHSSRKGQ